MFFGPGQQPGFMPPQAAGRTAMPFAPQQAMMMPGVQGGRPGQFAGMAQQQGGRGAVNGAQQMPPNAYGLPAQMPFGAMPPAAANFPGNMSYPQAMAQVQAQLGRGSQGGRGQMPAFQGIQAMQGMPPQMIAAAQQQAMRGRDSRSQYPAQSGRGGMGLGMGGQASQMGQMGGFSQQARAPMNPAMGQAGMPLPGAAGPSATPNYDALTAAPPAQQKQLIGETLYPKIQVIQPNLAGKITGMLLEMDNSELIGL